MSKVSDKKKKYFDEKDVLHKLKHYLPSQTPLKDFVHHNTLHAFQNMKFYDAIFKSSEIFGYQVTFQLNEYRKLFKTNRIKKEILDKVIKKKKGEKNYIEWYSNVVDKKYDSFVEPRIGKLRNNWKTSYKIDINNLVQPLLFRVICSYLDQGIALWHFPFEDKGLLNAIRHLEEKSFTSFFKTKRARDLLFNESCSIEKLLDILIGDKSLYEQYLFDQQFSHIGWSGMVATIEEQPETILYSKKISLQEFIIFELLLEIDALSNEFGEKWVPLSKKISLKPTNLFENIKLTELHDVLMIWQDSFEWSYYDEILYSLKHIKENKEISNENTKKKFQAIFCIDDRECSIRRYLEHVEPNCETLGAPGFFGVEFYFHAYNGKFYEKLCPANITPKYLIKERESDSHKKHEILYSKKSHTLFKGFIASLSLGLFASIKLISNIFDPKISSSVYDSFSHMDIEADLIIENKSLDDRENNLQIGFTIEEMADRVENLLKGIALINNFSSIVYVIGHGSRSANNPYQHAYDCGACSGRPGGVNSRVLAFMANHPKVREVLSNRGLKIPDETQFVSALHNTTSDEILFYDEKILSESNKLEHSKNKELFEEALNHNAKERSRRFESINTKSDIKKIRESIIKRSVSYFEPRPELNHSTNALCFVGHRSLTSDLFLDRRAFMNSYDYRTDPEGELLFSVIKPLPTVCGGINLEYYFSRMDNYKLGAGTKLPHNVMGLSGVANSSDGDLRTGLPSQMIEVHDPIRLMMIVEHYPDVILKTIQSSSEVYEWFINEWVHFISINPDNNNFYLFKDGKFELYDPITSNISKINNLHNLIESTKGTETNYIVDATKENIPVHIITKE
jgi:uncharacterized protein YbcC (UPF0753/DUF2309 family)